MELVNTLSQILLKESGIRNIKALAERYPKAEIYFHQDTDGVTTALAMKNYLESYGIKVIGSHVIQYGDKEFSVQKPLIDKALKHSNGELLTKDILEFVLKERQYLFVGTIEGEIQSALIGELIYYPRKLVFRIITWSTSSGYDYEKWMPLFNIIEDFARSKRCDFLEAWTRKGLARKIQWDNEHSIITKQL